MRKIILLMFLCTAFFACVPEKRVSPRPYLVNKIDKFKNEHPNWRGNDLIRKEVNNVFIDSLKLWFSHDGVLDSLPIKISEVGEHSLEGRPVYGVVATSGGGYGAWNSSDILLYFLLDKTTALALNDRKRYYVDAEIVEMIQEPEGLEAGIRAYDLGTYRIEVDSIWVK